MFTPLLKDIVIKLTASANGESTSYTYTYKVYDGSKWLTLKSNTTSTTYTTTAGTSGSMKYVVVVKDSTGKTVDSNKITVTIVNEEFVGTLKVNGLTSNQTVNVGSAITLTVSASGGSGTYTYKAYDGSKWLTLKSNTTSTTYTTIAGTSESMRYVVVVKDSTGKTVDSNKITVTNEDFIGTLKVNGLVSNQIVNVGSTIILAISATGGNGNYTYTYKAYNGSKWVTLKSNTTSTTYRTTAEISGSMKYVVVVKDSTGKTVDSNKIIVTTYK